MPDFFKKIEMTITTVLNQLFNQLEMMDLNTAQGKIVCSVYKSVNKASQ